MHGTFDRTVVQRNETPERVTPKFAAVTRLHAVSPLDRGNTELIQ